MFPFHYRSSTRRQRLVWPMLRTLVLICAVACGQAAFAQSKKAEKYFEDGRYDEAIRLLKKDFFSKTMDVDAGRMLAMAYYETHRYEDALDVLNLIGTDQTDDSEDIRFYADVLIANDDFSGAYLTLIERLSVSETDADAYIWLDKTADLIAWDSLRTLSEFKEIDGLNTVFNEYGPYVANDGELWYISDRNTLQVVFPAAFTNQNLHLYHRTRPYADDSLKMRKPSMLMKVRDYYYHDGPIAKWPNQEEYALTLREIDGLQHKLKYGIFFSHLTGAEDDIRPFEHNGKTNTGHATFTADGRRMYFASDREGGHGKMDLWYSDWVDGEWTEPTNLGPEVNTEGNEMYPVLHDYRLYYSSDRRDMGYGALDLYYVSLLNSPYKPYNLRAPLNSAYDDFSIRFYDHENGYVASDRRDGAGGDDVYAFKFIPERLPIDTMQFKILPAGDADLALAVYDVHGVKVAEGSPNRFGVVSFPNLNTGEVYSVEVLGDQSASTTVYRVDEDGNEVAMEMGPSGAHPVEILSDRTFAFVTQAGEEDLMAEAEAADSASTFTDAEPSEEGESVADELSDMDMEDDPEAEALARLAEGEEFIKSVPTVYYDFDSYELRPDAIGDLNALAETIKRSEGIHVKVVSHTDARGPKSYNLRLSEKRALSVINYLEEQGVDRERLSSVGKGESELTNDCGDGKWCPNEEHAKNRRTEFVFKRMAAQASNR